MACGGCPASKGMLSDMVSCLGCAIGLEKLAAEMPAQLQYMPSDALDMTVWHESSRNLSGVSQHPSDMINHHVYTF